MPKKKKKNNLAAFVAAGFVIALFVAVPIAAPLLTKKDKADEQDQTNQILEQYKKQQAEAAAKQPPKEVDTNLKQSGDVTSMQIIDLTTGTGQEAKLGDKITVKYKGALATEGTIFDSNSTGVELSLKGGSGGVIEGWVEGVPGMKVGGKRKLVIPSEKAYGPQGSGDSIPPDSDLVFEIELISIAN